MLNGIVLAFYINVSVECSKDLFLSKFFYFGPTVLISERAWGFLPLIIPSFLILSISDVRISLPFLNLAPRGVRKRPLGQIFPKPVISAVMASGTF